MENSGWNRGWQLLLTTFRIFGRYPIFLIPILIVWMVYAPTIIYLKYCFPWSTVGFGTRCGVIFFTLFIFSFIILCSCAVVLELIQQIETGKNLNLTEAIKEVLIHHFSRLLPLALIWSIIWFILTIIEAVLSKGKKENNEPNLKNITETLAGGGEFQWMMFCIRALKKGVRMIVFLILPAIAWEEMRLGQAIDKGLDVLSEHLSEFASGYALTFSAAVIVFLPPGIMIELGTARHHHEAFIQFSDTAWSGMIVYIGFAWSFCMYLEQMFVANLYLWHLKWEKSIELAKKNNQPLPEFKDVKRPSLLDDTPDLLTQ